MGRLEAGMQEAEDRLKQAGGLLISSVETYVFVGLAHDLYHRWKHVCFWVCVVLSLARLCRDRI